MKTRIGIFQLSLIFAGVTAPGEALRQIIKLELAMAQRRILSSHCRI